MAIVMSGQRPFLDIDPWEQKIRSVLGEGFYAGLHRVRRLVDDLRRCHLGRKLLMRMLEAP